jgi:hypothetical protein
VKRLLIAFAILLFTATSIFAGYVNGYYKKNGTYVQGYYRADSNKTVKDNYSYYGNVNPYTGEIGKNKYKKNKTSAHYQGYAYNQ